MAAKGNKRHPKAGGVKRLSDEPAFQELVSNLESGKVDPARFRDYLKGEANKDLGEVLSVPQVGAFLGVSRQTVYRLIKTGAIKGQRVGSRWRFSKRAIIAWIEGGK